MALRTKRGFAPDDVDRIEVIAPPLIVRLVGRPLPPSASATYARLCMGYAVAKVLQNGQLDLAAFRGDALDDPVTHALAARVETRSDDNPDPNAMAPQAVVVHLKDGTALRWRCATMLGNSMRRLTCEQHLAKFHRCCTFSQDNPWRVTRRRGWWRRWTAFRMWPTYRVLTEFGLRSHFIE